MKVKALFTFVASALFASAPMGGFSAESRVLFQHGASTGKADHLFRHG